MFLFVAGEPGQMKDSDPADTHFKHTQQLLQCDHALATRGKPYFLAGVSIREFGEEQIRG
jgi:hypothetical protein